MVRKFQYCCVCGKSADASVMKPAEPLRGLARVMALTMLAPAREYIHEKCERRLQSLVAMRNETFKLRREKEARDDAWHA